MSGKNDLDTDTDFALFNDILEDIAVKGRDEEQSFFGGSESKKLLKASNVENELPQPRSNQINANSNDNIERQKLDNSVEKNDKEIQHSDGKQDNLKASGRKISPTEELTSQPTLDHADENYGESYSRHDDKNIDESGKNSSNEVKKKIEDIHHSEGGYTSDELSDKEEIKNYDSYSSDEEHQSSDRADINNNGSYYTSSPSDSDEEIQPLAKANDEDSGHQTNEDDMPGRRLEKEQEILPTLKLEYKPPGVQRDLQTVSFSVQYDKFCKILSHLEKGLERDTPSLQGGGTDYTEAAPAIEKRKKRKVKKKRKTSNNDDINQCFCRNCKYSVYNQENVSPMSDMFRSLPHVQKKAVQQTRAKTAFVRTVAKKDSKPLIDLGFQSNYERNIKSKLDADLKNSHNPVLNAWLKVKKEEEKERRRSEKRQKRIKAAKEKKRLTQMRVRTAHATQRVQQWIDRKKSENYRKKEILSYDGPWYHDKTFYQKKQEKKFKWDKKNDKEVSEDEIREVKEYELKRAFLPEVVQRPKTSRGPLRKKVNNNLPIRETQPSESHDFFERNEQDLSVQSIRSESASDHEVKRNTPLKFIPHPPLNASLEKQEEEKKEKEEEAVSSDNVQKLSIGKNGPTFILNESDVCVSFESVREFTESVVREAIIEMEVNARLKERRLRRPMTASSDGSSHTEAIDENREKQSIEATLTKPHQEDINVQPNTQDINKSDQHIPNVKSYTSHKIVLREDMFIGDNWPRNEGLVTRKKSGKKVTKSDEHYEIDEKILRHELNRRLMEKSLAKKRVDTGLPRHVRPVTTTGLTRGRLQNYLLEENVYRYGRNQSVGNTN